ncbi:hypothetical protein [Dickeya dianthicola]|uniref:hypothetical protein n=1 Tax=Dickeya dianthicola TaxID=204039 RepID=UPI001319D5CB|nr:hypothetical protein [Dickeya dianthicola]MBI0437131.1 hypothetical protein [Dickeya dianthicola]MBI0448665.1 hypothetical protein [Dickeya dianthicola]MBI0452092.1 hypothetical protein [Dickeya dianthicola]MBI0456330.1 hypothetical protein [Dickeya dianthicola]MBI0460486.1 hypothetical protein [Dickeya dianthicola]
MAKQLTYAQLQFLDAAVSGRHTPRSPTNSTGNALARRGLVSYSFAIRGWTPTQSGIDLLKGGTA